ncbi:Thioredoxin domain-containing protein 3 like protein [Dufourea novaeangliae]|uniref:Thioredoxin domain-containing protein 3 like protein n=1 Tax=Dufourea novaeangliae TaxID=178035 RepID=A0A154NWN2_DUFNO|nr:Thioredoxin domain-containing protein 3 like protein [Dufourea novaeangliae]
MAKKTVPAALQIEISNDEDWEKLLKKTVVDVYSEWSGPCTGMVSTLKKIKMEIGGDALSYATAKCDYITDLERFQGKSEPIWMFIHNGRMINLMFGAQCPQLLKMLTTELQRVQNGEEHEFSIDVSERSPEEVKRLKIIEETRIAKEAAKKARKEAEAVARYETEMLHFTTSLNNETCLLLYPWIFKDEESHRRDKKSSPPYVELIEEILPGNYTVEQEIRKRLNEDILDKLFDESDYVLPKNCKELLLDGKCMFMRLKITEEKLDVDIHTHLLNLLYGEPELPNPEKVFTDECYAGRHRPAFMTTENETDVFPLVWTPPNCRNKAIVYRTIFATYTNKTYPYEDKAAKVPTVVFKYDYTRKNELKIVLEEFEDEVANFGIFESDKPPEAKIIAKSIDEFEKNIRERTGYETFVCVVKKVGCEAFLGFAGIGPYHVSENPEKGLEESKLYFPDNTTLEDTQSDDDEKPEELIENPEESNNAET